MKRCAAELLDELPEFSEVKRGFDADTRKRWNKSVRFFKRRELTFVCETAYSFMLAASPAR